MLLNCTDNTGVEVITGTRACLYSTKLHKHYYEKSSTINTNIHTEERTEGRERGIMEGGERKGTRMTGGGGSKTRGGNKNKVGDDCGSVGSTVSVWAAGRTTVAAVCLGVSVTTGNNEAKHHNHYHFHPTTKCKTHAYATKDN